MDEGRPHDMAAPSAIPEPAETPTEPVSEAAERRPARRFRTGWATLGALVMLVFVMMLTGQLDSLARNVMRFFEAVPSPPIVAETREAATGAQAGTYLFNDLDIHPDVLYQPYTAGPVVTGNVPSSRASMIEAFRTLLSLYEERQGIDDNFTIRVVDNRNNELLELYELERERERYKERPEGQEWNWDRIDGLRREATNQLIRKYVDRGIPQSAITVKWGRADQVREARKREEAFIEYEVGLARYLGLSLLATEIGTVETFNSDRLVSSVGARSRYQMMPYVLRQNNIRHYDLATAVGGRISVYEEWHPLLTMEASFRTLAGYVNAVGHEIPGISAYHTGPGNIFSVYRMYLTSQGSTFDPSDTVMDAYMWAVTQGYDYVSRNSSFKTYSRGYVASAYGSLRAMENTPIDSTKTLRAERVQVAPGKEILLSRLLGALGSKGEALNWGPDSEGLSLYSRFRKLNPHFNLPADSTGGVPPTADVRLVATMGDAPVRFFLPIGASALLAEAQVDVLDPSKKFVYDRNTFGRPPANQITMWDRQYADLVNDIAHFGFNSENRRQLFYLADRFEELARANPTHFRLTQLEVIRTHKGIWQSGVYEKLASAVAATRGSSRMQTRPPAELPAR